MCRLISKIKRQDEISMKIICHAVRSQIMPPSRGWLAIACVSIITAFLRNYIYTLNLLYNAATIS